MFGLPPHLEPMNRLSFSREIEDITSYSRSVCRSYDKCVLTLGVWATSFICSRMALFVSTDCANSLRMVTR